MDRFFLDYCYFGYLSADNDLFHDIVNVRLHADMLNAEIDIYIYIIGEGEKVHYSSFACKETTG